jgi:hypothetical protein
MFPAAQFLLLALFCSRAWAGGPLERKEKIVALVFLSSECPISNKMIPEIERLHTKFATNGVALYLVYPNASDTEARIDAHRKSYRVTAPCIRDPRHELVERARVSVTPEAAVFDAQRKLVYHGRINDRFLALGRARPEARTRDLEDAIESALAGQAPRTNYLPAVGCYIEMP